MNSIFTSLKNFIFWQRVPARSIQFKALDREIAPLVGYAILYTAVGYWVGLLILRFPLPILGATQFNQDVWYSIVFKIVLLLLAPSAVYFGLWKYKLGDLLLGVKLNLFSMIAAVALGLFLNIGHWAKIQESIGNFPGTPLRLALGIVMPLFIAALPEEFYFRGYLQTRLESKWGRLAAILISSVLFTAWHLPSRYLLSHGVEGEAGNWGQIVLSTGLPVFIFGALLGWHWSRYRNMVVLVLFHWAGDILPSLSSYFKIPF